jgi:monofunctional biosynthetic peptidoglycan transglycosylase
MMKWIKWAAIIAILAVAADILVTFVYPDVSILKKHNPSTTAFMEYRKKQWAEEGLHKTIDQRWVKLKKVSPYLIKAVIIGEDDKFWKHEGFDFDAMKKALEKDIAEGKLKAGGSSISQQLAKNLYLSPSKNPIRKVKEAILTWRIEKSLSKKRIMELYVNIAEWGDGIFGIEAAARHHYGKRARALTAQEAVRLASVLPNPIVFDPRSTTSSYVRKRSRAIYRVMRRRGIVIPEYEEVMSAPEEKTEEAPVDIMALGMDGVSTENTDSFETTGAPAEGETQSWDSAETVEPPAAENHQDAAPLDPGPEVEENSPPEDIPAENQTGE